MARRSWRVRTIGRQGEVGEVRLALQVTLRLEVRSGIFIRRIEG